MRPLRKILYPVDFSNASLAIVPYVREMAQRFGASITLLHAFNVCPGYVLAPRFGATSEFEPAPVPYTPALRELRGQQQQWLENFGEGSLLTSYSLCED